MKLEANLVAAISAPSIGPTVLIVFGIKLPIAALALSMVGLLLARYINPRSARKLSRGRELALTALLALLLVVIVAGEFPVIGNGKPLGVGMAVAWGVGLGTSGLVAVNLLGGSMMAGLRAAVRAAFGLKIDDKGDPLA